MIIKTTSLTEATGQKGKVRDFKLKDVDDYDFNNGTQTRYMTSDEQNRSITLPNGKPAQIYTKGDIVLTLIGERDWLESGLGRGCEIVLFTDDDEFHNIYNNVNTASKDFKAMMVDLDNDEALGDIVKEYHLS